MFGEDIVMLSGRTGTMMGSGLTGTRDEATMVSHCMRAQKMVDQEVCLMRGRLNQMTLVILVSAAAHI